MTRKKGPPTFNGFYVPQYYAIRTRTCDFNIGAAPRSGSTSLYHFAKKLELAEQAIALTETPKDAICLIREPIARLASAYLLLPEGVNSRDPVTNFKTVGRPSFEETVDAVLNDDGQAWFDAKIGSSAHAFAWQPQTELYSECEFPVWVKLEGNGGFFGMQLPHENKAQEPKPEVTYRLNELKDFYAEDTKIWNMARTKVG
ncbi:MAG TPA: hypothetical protein VMW50_06780 [Dehalococcoidia bacterium]|jgi:hypothetical protein|nr:hypothetical protein [Dehalococcoidia bacterium]